MNPKINGGLWGIMTYQYRFISCNKCISLVQALIMQEAVHDRDVGGGVFGNSVNLKLL